MQGQEGVRLLVRNGLFLLIVCREREGGHTFN